jgi:AsmA protein
MNRKWLYVAGAAVAVILLVIILLPFVLDANQYRPRIESMLNQGLNRKVSIGNIRLSILSGGVSIDNIAIADDPAFSSGMFLEAKSLNVGVELMPLIFSHALNVTGISIDAPQVTLLRSASGVWNFSTLGPAAAGGAAPAQTPGQAANTNVSVQKLTLKDGTVFVGDVAGAGNKRHEYQQVDVDASNLSYTTQFPFELTTKTPGTGTIKLSGKAGPINQADMQETPLDASVDVQNVDLNATGFIDPASGIAGVANFTGSLTSDGQQMNFKGKVSGNKLQLVQGGAPAAVPVQIDFEAGFGIKARSGTLKQGDVHIGKAVAHLTGTYSTAQQTPSVQMKLDGQSMPAADLEGMLPAVGVILPSGASIQSGTVNASLTIDGPADRLVTSGPVSLSNAKLAGFDLGSKMGALSSFAGVPKGTDTMIQTLSADLRIAPDGIRVDKLLVVVPAIGSITGSGTIAANHALNFKMAAKVGNASSPVGGLASLASVAGGQSGGIPFTIHGTTSNPSFEPDVNAMVGGLAKGALAGGKDIPGGQNLGQALGGLLGRKKKP